MVLWLKQTAKCLKNVLVAESIPVWLSIVLMVAGAFGAYWIAPLINEKFEIQAAKREFLVNNLNEFSSNTRDLIDLISKVVNEKDQSKFNQNIIEANPSFAKLQFSAAQLLYIVPENNQVILSFQSTLNDLQEDLIVHNVKGGSQSIMENSKKLMRESINIYDSLLGKVGFRN